MAQNKQDIINLMNRMYDDKLVNKSLTLDEENKLYVIYDDYIKENPHDTDMRLHYILCLNKSLGNPEDIPSEIEKIFSYDPYNPYAVILFAQEQYIWGEITAETLHRLEAIQTNNIEILSLKYLYIAYYYDQQCDDNKYEQFLLESIFICDDYPQNYFDLAELYVRQGKISQAIQIYKKALFKIKNVKKEGMMPRDVININVYFDHYIKNLYPHEIIVSEIKSTYGI